MKKWLAACLLAIALLFVTTAAMAGHTKKNGEYCLGGSYALLKEYEKQHLLRCNDCQEELLEDHFVGNADSASCIVKKKCGGCTQPLGWGDHDWGDWESNGNGTHTRTCKRLGTHTEMEECTFSVAPCTEPAACTECGASYKLGGHDWGRWESNGDKTHTHVCTRDPSHTETKDCGDFLEADCTTPAMCWYCRGTHGETDPSKHDWGHPRSNGDGTHTYTCFYNSNHTKKEACTTSGPFHGEMDWCDECGGEMISHNFGGSWVSDADGHWKTCLDCEESQRKVPHSFVELADAKHLKSEATCVSGAVYYRSCSECGYHAPDTFESGDKNPNNHDLVPRGYKAPTCTEIGWKDYDTCSRCDYTTYRELDALGHAYEARTVQPTCTKAGYTLHTCTRCKASYTDAVVSSRGHWYGEWSPNGDAASSADCRRSGCRHTGKVLCEPLVCRLLLKNAEAYDFTLCPVCGEVSDGVRLTLIEKAKATAQRLPRGELVLRIGDLQNGERMLSVGFEYGGRLTLPTGQVEIMLPAAMLDGYALMLLDADGVETALPHTLNGDEATFTLDFTTNGGPAMALRLISVS